MRASGDEEDRPNSYFVLAIISIVAFWPVGLAALSYSTKVDALYFHGNVERAHYCSRKARKLAIIAFIPVIVAIPVAVFLAVVSR
jgi:hypothetical protein